MQISYSCDVRHATAADLDVVEPLLAALREVDGLRERSRGVFSRRSKAFVHFHGDPTGVHADVRVASGDFERVRVESPDEQAAFLAIVRSL